MIEDFQIFYNLLVNELVMWTKMIGFNISNNGKGMELNKEYSVLTTCRRYTS